MGANVRYASTLRAESNDPTEIQKADFDLLAKINELAAILDGSTGSLGLVPVGCMMPYAGPDSSIPTRWLLCNGQEVSRVVYAALFAAIGTTWGAGDGSKTFNLPDLVGATPAGAGTSTGYTQNETVTFGQKIDDQMQGHRHPPLNGSFYTNASGTVSDIANGALRYTQATTGNPVTDTVNGTPRTGSTTHGKLVGVNYIIRAA
jgi:microcystin-dependent protein